MPLDARKAKHITAKLDRVWAGRTQAITLHLQQTGGAVTTLVVNGIFKANDDEDPSLFVQHGPDSLHNADAIMMVKTADVSYQQLRSCIYVSLAAPVGVQFASRYLVTSIGVKGVLPGGDRWLVGLDRQRQ